MESNKRILIIDDDEGVRHTYESILAAPGNSHALSRSRALFGEKSPDSPEKETYPITLAEDGCRGIEEVQTALAVNKPFALAFVDMKMPGLNGAETVKQIWQLCPDLKIVMVTAYSEYSPESIMEIIGRRDLFYLRKPFTREEIAQFARVLTNEWNLEKKRRLLENRLDRMNKQLKKKVKAQAIRVVQSEKMAALGVLAAGVAHEINNPVAFVNANLTGLRADLSPLVQFHRQWANLHPQLQGESPRAQKALQTLLAFQDKHQLEMILGDLPDLVEESIEGTQRIQSIVADLKNFSREDSKTPAPEDINGLMDSTLNMVKNEIKYKAEVEKDYGNIPPVSCHGRRISQVFMNLLVNAAQAIESQGTIHVHTRMAEEMADHVEIQITDTGPGIPPRDLTRLFDPFFTTKPIGTGTGLGLSIAHEIIQAHQGTIEAENTKAGGACFTIRLPAGEGGP